MSEQNILPKASGLEQENHSKDASDYSQSSWHARELNSQLAQVNLHSKDSNLLTKNTQASGFDLAVHPIDLINKHPYATAAIVGAGLFVAARRCVFNPEVAESVVSSVLKKVGPSPLIDSASRIGIGNGETESERFLMRQVEGGPQSLQSMHFFQRDLSKVSPAESWQAATKDTASEWSPRGNGFVGQAPEFPSQNFNPHDSGRYASYKMATLRPAIGAARIGESEATDSWANWQTKFKTEPGEWSPSSGTAIDTKAMSGQSILASETKDAGTIGKITAESLTRSAHERLIADAIQNGQRPVVDLDLLKNLFGAAAEK